MFKKIISKFFTREIITYVIAGVLTTIVNFVCSYIMFNLCHIDENITTVVSWVVAVIFAYFINNYWVFLDNTKNVKKESVKFVKFVVARLFTLVVEEAGIYLFITRLGFRFWFVKLPLTVIVMILNYIFSKMMIFLKDGTKTEDNSSEV